MRHEILNCENPQTFAFLGHDDLNHDQMKSDSVVGLISEIIYRSSTNEVNFNMLDWPKGHVS